MPFQKAGIAAFPHSCREKAKILATALLPVVDDDYRKPSKEVFIGNEIIRIPSRIHFVSSSDAVADLPEELHLMAYCLYTRSTDGHLRHSSLKKILASNYAWCIPYIVMLSGEYVVEVIQDIAAALPTFNRIAYVSFVLENRALMRLLRMHATSYWNRYYNNVYEDKISYPGLQVLNELEHWVAQYQTK